MKHILNIFICIILCCPAWGSDRRQDSLAFIGAEWKITELENHAVAMSAQIQMFGSEQHISILRYPSRKFRTAFIHSPGKLAKGTSGIAEREGAAMAINGSYFNMKQLLPCTYFRIGENVYGNTAESEGFRVNAVVGIKNNKGHKIRIIHCEPSQYERLTDQWHSVLAAGPLLMDDHKIVVPEITLADEDGNGTDAFYDKRHPRSVIGYDDKGNIYMIVIDGRHPGKAEGTDIYETALICSFLNLEDAINLDGGGSSALWSDDEGILNHPSDNKRFDDKGERKVPNIIGVFR